MGSIPEALDRWGTTVRGLSQDEVSRRLALYGPNILAKDQRPSVLRLLHVAFFNPLVLLLGVLGLVSFATGDFRAGGVILVMIALGVGLRLFQEARAGNAVARLKSLTIVSATAERDGESREIPVSQLVPGDIVQLAAGDMVPADLRLVSARDLFVVQSSLTGEGFPVEKCAEPLLDAGRPCLELANMTYLGTSVASGAATGLVVATGASTYLGSIAASLADEEPPSAFDRGVERFT
jgi:Mg2+-importing ATPase